MDPIESFTGWVARYTLLLAIITAASVYGFLESEQPFLAINQIKVLTETANPAKPFILSLTIDNTGKSVGFATDVYLRLMTVPKLQDVPTYAKPPQYSERRIFVTPGGKTTISSEPREYNSPGIMTTDLIENAAARGHKLFVWGRIEYHGPSKLPWIFGLYSHVTGFCKVYQPSKVTGDQFTDCGFEKWEYAD
jgi:hypothetical protein